MNIVRKYPKYHSTGGLLTVSSQQNVDPILVEYMKSVNIAGYPVNGY